MKCHRPARQLFGKIIQTERSSLLNTLSIRDRLIVIFLTVSIIPLILMGGISYYISKTAIADKITKYSLRELTQITNNLNLELKKYEDFSDQTISNEVINQELSECVNNTDLSFIDINQRLKKVFDAQVITWGNGQAAILFCGNKNKVNFTAGTGNISAEDFRNTSDYSKTVAKKGQIHWFYQKGTLGFSRIVGDLNTLKPVGVIAIVLNLSRIDQVINYTLYKDNHLSEKAIFKQPYSLIINREGVILSSPFQDDSGKNITTLVRDRKFLKKLEDLGETAGKFPEQVKHKAVLMTVNPIPEKGWYLLGLAPNSYLYAESVMVGLSALGLGLIISIIVVIISIKVALGISQPLKLVMEGMQKAENGDLSISVNLNNRDELGQLSQSFNRMIRRIQGLIRETKDVVAEVLQHSRFLEESSVQSAQTAKAVMVATTEIAQGTVAQTAEAEKTTFKMADLSQRIEAVVIKSNEIEEITESVRTLGSESQGVIDRLIQKAKETDNITNMVVNDMGELSSSTKEIHSLTEVIANISEQSNLLALNAAIEAARAGEYGTGFAVVAEEINKLAVQSQNAARTINKILKEIQTKSSISAATVSKAHRIVEEQLLAVEQANNSFIHINVAMVDVVSRMSKVNENIQKIHETKEETIQSITNISAVSEEAATAAEEVLASTEEQTAIVDQVSGLAGELLKKSDRLVRSMAQFKIDL